MKYLISTYRENVYHPVGEIELPKLPSKGDRLELKIGGDKLKFYTVDHIAWKEGLADNLVVEFELYPVIALGNPYPRIKPYITELRKP